MRILILADIQSSNKLTEKEQNSISKLIKIAKPDLIVLLGDMIQGLTTIFKRQAEQIIKSIMAPIVSHGVPFAITFGNHDSDSRVSLEDQVRIYRSFPGCLTPLPSKRPCQEAYSLNLPGFPFQLLFIDSGKTRIGAHGVHYYPPKPETLKYSKELLDNPASPETIIFQHVIVPDVCRLLKSTKSDKEGIRGKGPFKGQKLVLKNKSAGTLGEMPCPSWSNKKEFMIWVKSGKVSAAVFAHDHVNSFSDELDGITIIQTASAGLTCYGDDSLRGGRLLTLTNDGKIKTEELRYSQLH